MVEDTLADRVAALERAVTDGHADDGLPDAARTSARLDEVEERASALDDRVSELEATVQALRGFAGGVRAVDEAVERRANDAVARAERLETELRAVEERLDRAEQSSTLDATHEGNTSPATESGEFESLGARATDEARTTTVDQHATETNPRATTTAADPQDATDGLQERVRTETDAALAATAATADQPTEDDESESASLGERLRRLL